MIRGPQSHQRSRSRCRREEPAHQGPSGRGRPDLPARGADSHCRLRRRVLRLRGDAGLLARGPRAAGVARPPRVLVREALHMARARVARLRARPRAGRRMGRHGRGAEPRYRRPDGRRLDVAARLRRPLRAARRGLRSAARPLLDPRAVRRARCDAHCGDLSCLDGHHARGRGHAAPSWPGLLRRSRGGRRRARDRASARPHRRWQRRSGEDPEGVLRLQRLREHGFLRDDGEKRVSNLPRAVSEGQRNGELPGIGAERRRRRDHRARVAVARQDAPQAGQK